MDYAPFLVKEYDQWDLFVHPNQYPYIGRCYVVAKRDDAKKVTDMNETEREELFSKILPDWNRAVALLLQHDWPNLAILGNTFPHLHAHLIPRYHTPRTFEWIEFIDPNPTGNYAPYEKRKLDEAVIFALRDRMREILT